MVQAQQLFADLTEEGTRRDRRPLTLLPGGEPPPPPPPQDPAEAVGRSEGTREAVDLARAALLATDGLADVLSVHADAAAADLVELGQVIEQALSIVNHRLDLLERMLRPDEASDTELADQAVDRLRRMLRRTAQDTEGSGAS